MLSRKKIDALWEEAQVIADRVGDDIAFPFARLVEAEALRDAARDAKGLNASCRGNGFYGPSSLRARASAAAKAAREGR